MSQMHVDLLTAAKEQIQSGKEAYICFAIDEASQIGKGDVCAYREIIEYIKKSLGVHSCAHQWLFCKLHNMTYDQMLDSLVHLDMWCRENRSKIQEWRCRWIDQMIEIFRDAK